VRNQSCLHNLRRVIGGVVGVVLVNFKHLRKRRVG
jgi:hypothetical protein